MEVITLKLLN